MKTKDLLRHSKGGTEKTKPVVANADIRDGSGGVSCNGDFCKLVERFQVPAKGDLQQQFLDYVYENGSSKEIAVGKKGEILKRANFPFCRLVSSSIRGGLHADASDESICSFVYTGRNTEQYYLKIHNSR